MILIRLLSPLSSSLLFVTSSEEDDSFLAVVESEILAGSSLLLDFLSLEEPYFFVNSSTVIGI